MGKKYILIILILIEFAELFNVHKIYADRRFLSGYIQNIHNIDNGFPVTVANDILQSDDGYIWIASYNGLIRYNGHEFKIFNNFSDQKLISNSIKVLFEDSKKRIWIGTSDCGVILYENGEFRNFGKEDGIKSLSIKSFAEDSSGNIIVSSTSGIYKINSDYKAELVEIPGLDSNYINAAVCDVNGDIWGIDSAGEVFELSMGGKIKIFKKGVLTENYASSIFINKNNKVFVGTSGNEIIEISKRLDDYNYKSLSTGSRTDISEIYEDSEERLWVCSNNGLGYFDAEENFNEIDGLIADGAVEKVIEDYEHNIWVTCPTEGILELKKSSFTNYSFEKKLDNRQINSIIKYKEDFYLGTDNGLIVLDSNGDYIQNSLTEKLNNTKIKDIIIDSDENLWIGTYDYGIIKYNGSDFFNINNNNSELSSNKVKVMMLCKNGDIAVGTTNGLNIIRNDKVIEKYTSQNGLYNPVVMSICEDDDGRIYVGSDGNGIYVVNDNKIEDKSSDIDLESGSILCMKKDTETNGIWIADQNKLYYYNDGKTECISNLKILDSNIYDIEFWNDEMWFITSEGIYNAKRNDVYNNCLEKLDCYDKNDGLTSMLASNSKGYIDEDGNMYLCCSKGINVINVKNKEKYEGIPKVNISSIETDKDHYEMNSGIEEIELDERNKKIIFSIDIVNFKNNFDGKLMYYLDGFDENPLECVEGNTDITYMNLKGGDYKFYLQLFDENDNLIEEKTVSIHKKMKLWDYNCVRIISLLIVIAIIILFNKKIFMMRTKKINEKQEKYEKLVKQTVMAIAKTIDAKDKYTNGHSKRVAQYSVEIAKGLKMCDEEIKNIYYAGLLHDIGKIGVPNSILNKPGKLTDEEFDIIKKHTSIGGEILKEITIIDNIAEGARYHHERYDGNGYMEGLKGKEIPLVARIICVADTYDAMHSDRVYRKGLSDEDILEEFKRCSGKQFDPDVVNVAIEILEKKIKKASKNNKKINS